MFMLNRKTGGKVKRKTVLDINKLITNMPMCQCADVPMGRWADLGLQNFFHR